MENNIKFKPTTEWMAQKYNEMNSQLFDNRLGECHFRVFTTGTGSQGRRLGYFGLKNRNIRVSKYTRRMFIPGTWNYNEININKSNFFEVCDPYIELNGNYSATEKGWLNTLIHEMCHYYTYMNGLCPKQGHGPEFRQIASYVSYKSNGTITIERLANAEEMSDFELDKDFKEKIERRNTNKINRLQCIIIETNSDNHELTLTSNDSLLKKIIEINTNGERSKNCKRILWTSDSNLIKTLFDLGYKKNLRTYRYWTMNPLNWEKIKDFNFVIINEKTPAMANTVTLNENDIRTIVENTIMELINNNENSIAINPDIPLSELSPFEY